MIFTFLFHLFDLMTFASLFLQFIFNICGFFDERPSDLSISARFYQFFPRSVSSVVWPSCWICYSSFFWQFKSSIEASRFFRVHSLATSVSPITEHSNVICNYLFFFSEMFFCLITQFGVNWSVQKLQHPVCCKKHPALLVPVIYDSNQ